MTEDDIVLAVGATEAALKQASRTLGEAVPGSLVPDRRYLDYLRVFASRPAVAGKQLGELELPGGGGTSVLHVRRGDTDLLARPDLTLEYGDRVGLLAHRRDFAALRRYFGDSIKGTAELSYISVGLGMALGFVLGAIAIPIPGMSAITLGLLGVLIGALILGNLQRTGGINWTMPVSANLVLRNLGLTLFLAQVGMSAGPTFVATVAQHGLLMLILGALATIALVTKELEREARTSGLVEGGPGVRLGAPHPPPRPRPRARRRGPSSRPATARRGSSSRSRPRRPCARARSRARSLCLGRCGRR